MGIIYYILLIGMTASIWTTLAFAPVAEYDMNYALLFLASIASMIFYTGLCIYWLIKKDQWKRWLLSALLYTITSSPFIIIPFCLNFGSFFYLKV